jgi:beta-glucosidase
VTRPVRELKGFRKVRVAAKGTEEVSFKLTRQDLQFVGVDGAWRAEPGMFDIWIAPSSAMGNPVTLQLLDDK